MIISHVDQDHIGGILTILEELQVGEAIIAKQYESSENYEKFLKIVKEKNIKVRVVKKGDVIKFDNLSEFDVIWPEKDLIKENSINNNAIVGKLKYKDFSCLFTGDIEKIAEEKIIQEKSNIRSTVLKVAHHGSKTSSTDEFLDLVQPKMALIGVGKKNLFGHPSEETIEKLENRKVKVYRTDLDGEIKIKVFNKNLTITHF